MAVSAKRRKFWSVWTGFWLLLMLLDIGFVVLLVATAPREVSIGALLQAAFFRRSVLGGIILVGLGIANNMNMAGKGASFAERIFGRLPK